MQYGFDSPIGSSFFASLREGRSLKASIRLANIGTETGYRWLRDAFFVLRDRGLSVQEAQEALGYRSTRVALWEQQRVRKRADGHRHHLRVDANVERVFWASYTSGCSVDEARRAAGVGRSTAYRWVRKRFAQRRAAGVRLATVGRELRLDLVRAQEWEVERVRARKAQRRERDRAVREAVRLAVASASARAVPRAPSAAGQRSAQRRTRYWELVSQGLTNTAACKILGVSRRTGTLIRKRGRPSASSTPGHDPSPQPGRYLSLHERLQIADLRQLGCSLRRIGRELGRHASTIKREIDRNSDEQGRYLPRAAEEAARRRRKRPRAGKLVAVPKLRRLVQRKLNRYWSPDEISGWLRRTYPKDPSLRICPETIYRALLVPGGQGLAKRYAAKLRTGRRVRRTRGLTGPGHGPVVSTMTMISERPAEVAAKTEAGHWEGDLIIGVGCASAMLTLRERKTHYGLVVNLPHDHTAPTVNAAIARAMQHLPAHLRRTLTWDQGVEMARHQELAAATGLSVYFAEKSSPWQRGANENFNGLLRQFFPKGTDLSAHSDQHVAAVQHELNTRPRKTLGYRTPQALLATEKRRGQRRAAA